MHVILDRVESHDLLHVEWLGQVARLEPTVMHVRVAKHHLGCRAAWDEELLLLLCMMVWRRHCNGLLLRGLT